MGIAHAHSSVFSHLSLFRKHWKSKSYLAAAALRLLAAEDEGAGLRRRWIFSLPRSWWRRRHGANVGLSLRQASLLNSLVLHSFLFCFFQGKKKHKISFRISSGFYICVADQGVLVCRLPVLSFSFVSLLPHFVWFFHLRCRTRSSCLSVVCWCSHFSVLNLLPHFVWFSICGGDQGVLVFRLLMRSFVGLISHLRGADRVLVFRLPMRSFVGLVFRLRCRPRSSCLPSADAFVLWLESSPASRLVFHSALQTEEFLFLVCWCGHLSVLCCFFQPRQRSFFSAKGVENVVSVVCGLDFLCEESGLFVC